MPRLILLSGLPASGKSTYASNLTSLLSCTLLSSDDIIEDLGRREGLVYQQAYRVFADQAMRLLFLDAEAAFDADETVIWDQTNLTPQKRRDILDVTPEHYETVAVSFEFPSEVLAERQALRQARDGKEIPASILETMARIYQRPDHEEGFDEVWVMTPKGLRQISPRTNAKESVDQQAVAFL